jgi:hypothetical protein
VVAAHDFGGLGRLVDVGGGYGILLGTVLRVVATGSPAGLSVVEATLAG